MHRRKFRFQEVMGQRRFGVREVVTARWIDLIRFMKRQAMSSDTPSKPSLDALRTVPPDRDLFTDNLEQLMDRVNRFALASFDDAERSSQRIVRNALAREGVALSQNYAKLLAARDKHLKALGK